MDDNQKLIIFILSGLTFLSGCIAITLGCIFTPSLPPEENEENNQNVSPPNYPSRDITLVTPLENPNRIIDNYRTTVTTITRDDEYLDQDNNSQEEEVMVTFNPSYFEEFRSLEQVSETDF